MNIFNFSHMKPHVFKICLDSYLCGFSLLTEKCNVTHSLIISQMNSGKVSFSKNVALDRSPAGYKTAVLFILEYCLISYMSALQVQRKLCNFLVTKVVHHCLATQTCLLLVTTAAAGVLDFWTSLVQNTQLIFIKEKWCSRAFVRSDSFLKHLYSMDLFTASS